MGHIQIFWLFFKIGALTIGGGYVMLPMMEREIVDRRKWLRSEEVVDIFAVAQGLPGVIALNAASQVGFRVKGVLGGLAAVLGCVTPSILIITLIAAALSVVWGNPVLDAAFNGMGAAVCALIFNTVLKFLKNSVKDVVTGLIFVSVLMSALVFPVPLFVYVLAGIALGIAFGYIQDRRAKQDGRGNS